MTNRLLGRWGAEAFLSSLGALLPSTAVTVYLMDGVTPAALYTDITGTTALANPLNTDTAGSAGIFAQVGMYKVAVAGLPTQVIVVGPVGAELRADFTHPSFGGIVSGDWSPAIALARSALIASGGGVLTGPAGLTANISQHHEFGDGLAVQGPGGSLYVVGLRFKATAAGAGITISGSGGICAGFSIDGSNVTTGPALQVGTAASPGAHRTLIDVSSMNGGQDNWAVLYAQNHVFLGCNSQDATRHNLYISGSAAGHEFLRFESIYNAGGSNNIRVDCAIDGTAVIGVAYPEQITFQRTIAEGGAGTAATIYVANGGAGAIGPQRISFPDLVTTGHAGGAGTVTIDVLGNSTVFIEGVSTIFAPGSGTAALRVADTSAVYLRNVSFVGASPACAATVNLASTTCSLLVEGYFPNAATSGFTALFSGPGVPDNQVRLVLGTPVQVSRTAAGDVVWQAGYAGHTGWTAALLASGILQWYNGFSVDTTLGPSTAGVGAGLTLNKGLGQWGHAAPAAQPARCVTLADVIAVLAGNGSTA